MSKLLPVDGQPIKFQIWDTAGQEKYHSLAPMYYRGAAAAIVVYDITRPESFGTLQKWVAELKDKGPENIQICIAGNKKDLEEQRRVDAGEAELYAQEIGALYLETSAKDDTNVKEMFMELSRRLPQPSQTAPDARGLYLSQPQLQPKDRAAGTCC